MNVSDIVKALLSLAGKRIVDLAGYFGITKQSMSNKMVRGSWSSADLKKVAEFLGCDLLFEMPDGQKVYLHMGASKKHAGRED